MTVRSRRLWNPTVVTGATPTTLYTVPSGRTARLSSLRAVSVGGGTLYLSIQTGSIGVRSVGANGEVEFVTGAWVLNPGDTLTGQGLSALSQFTVTGFGALLLGAPA